MKQRGVIVSDRVLRAIQYLLKAGPEEMEQAADNFLLSMRDYTRFDRQQEDSPLKEIEWAGPSRRS